MYKIFSSSSSSSTYPTPSLSEALVKVTSIFIYPVKSCRGISVAQAPLTPTGFRWDRQWLVVNHKGRGYSQRNESKLALVQIELPNEAFSEGWEPTRSSYMAIRAPGMDVLKISLGKSHDVTDSVSVLEWSGSALDEGTEAANWFTNYLGKTSRLVRFDGESETRPVNPEYVRGHRILFSDQYPFMMVSQGSLDALNNLLKEPVPINRFRPNILVDGCEPFSEDLWTEVRINRFTFEGVKLCARCKVPNIDQETGIVGSEPNDTLRKFRSDEVLRPNLKQQKRIYFGKHLVCKNNLIAQGNGKMIKVGDPVFVLRKVSSAAEAAT